MTDENLDPLKPGYPFNAHLVSGITPIVKGDELDFWIDRPKGLKGIILNLTVSGAGLVFPGTPQEQTVRSGNLMLIPAGTKHDYGRHPDFHNWYHRWVYFRPRATWMDWLKWTKTHNGVGFLDLEECKTCEALPIIEPLFQSIDQSCKTHSIVAEELSLNLLEQVLIRCREYDNARPKLPVDHRILRVCQFINENLSKELSVEELSRVACMSNSRFSHLFKKQLGVSVRQWIEDQRISLARQLLITTDLAVNQISGYLGYQDALYFSRVFKKNLGVSPRDFRQTHL
ncbi:MAG: arabinose operon transcriptional regulator AraC [Reinekea forsetii]|uniref:Arabinose operon regulatory protein n=1 Tax=Reinekea forsetii TaxID=1336806 RepID=A0A2K8KM81_9GAMM|nr:arabinose operon transcriptional regulator AraC [Reinekea forsetii]ATX75958.1 arabinose operon regulatory protein [Reinekea forsetii]MDO7641162.1 arabinose operon transcriptional regulator AraC [Reinekea forsetii]MDO7645698.1 arabinose operon transcriptional regulator AraC [Reinekea forsetii]MDO7674803.1 arabinose operon transcriptional regulator AraC [Reinekea forsetii]